jgi:putative membrane protein|tara:strand:- start:1015 stop:1368 length:354 start_codon:yes stop_codon:yes gene_type:complete
VIQSLILQILSGILGLWLAARFVSGVEFTGSLQTLLAAGLILGLINLFIKPVIKLVSLPIRLLTFGLFGIIINMAMLWILDIVFPELIISGITPLFWATIIIWAISLIFSVTGKGKI